VLYNANCSYLVPTAISSVAQAPPIVLVIASCATKTVSKSALMHIDEYFRIEVVVYRIQWAWFSRPATKGISIHRAASCIRSPVPFILWILPQVGSSVRADLHLGLTKHCAWFSDRLRPHSAIVFFWLLALQPACFLRDSLVEIPAMALRLCWHQAIQSSCRPQC